MREIAATRDLTLAVWTGTYGTLQLPDLNDNPVDLYLGQVEGKEVLPVPAFMWKVSIYGSTFDIIVALKSASF